MTISDRARVIAAFNGEEGKFTVPQPYKFAPLPSEEWECFVARNAVIGKTSAYFIGPHGSRFSVVLD